MTRYLRALVEPPISTIPSDTNLPSTLSAARSVRLIDAATSDVLDGPFSLRKAMLRARYPTARPGWLRNFFGTRFQRRLLAERIRLGPFERELDAEGDALASLTNSRLPEKKIGALWHSRPAKTSRGFVVCAQFSRLSIAKKIKAEPLSQLRLAKPEGFSI